MNDETNILMIDDDVKLCRLVREYLGAFGFRVTAAHTGKSGLALAREGAYKAVILDVMLPEMDGFAVLKEIRKFSSVPILMLTALGDESDRIVGLEIGADDYLPKTFSTRELLARLRAVTRRNEFTQISNVETIAEMTFDNLRINFESRQVSLDGETLVLTALEFDLLVCLVKARGKVLDRDKILDEVAGRDYDVFDRSIDVHISSLRRKLGDDAKNPRFIKTVRSVGYMFEG